MTAYTPLNTGEKNAHTFMVQSIGRSGIYPSGEAHFFDFAQNLTDLTTVLPQPTSIFNYNQLGSQLSNATESYVIDDFEVFNPYIHNSVLNNTTVTIYVKNLLQIAVDRFNIYSTSFRNIS